MSSHIAASCLHPAGIKHGVHIGNDYGHGKTVRFQCDRQYTLEGKDRVTCNDGKWDSDPPNCKGMYYKSAFKTNAHITDALRFGHKSDGHEKSLKINISWQELKNQFVSFSVHRYFA